MLTYNKLKFAVCINSDDPDLLTPRMLYQILPDNNAARADYVRVIDNEGEDYFFRFRRKTGCRRFYQDQPIFKL